MAIIRALVGIPVLAILAAGVVNGSAASSVNVLSSRQQIESGAAVYADACARCHGAMAEGGRGPTLDRPTLAGYRSADRLFRFVRVSMPDDAPGSLSEQEYYDAIAFLLDLNGLNPDGVPLDPATATDISLTN